MDDWEALADAELNDIKVVKADKFKEEEDLALKKASEEKPKEEVKTDPVPKPSTKKKNVKKEPVSSSTKLVAGKGNLDDKKKGEQFF